jgi:hypothetical protein
MRIFVSLMILSLNAASTIAADTRSLNGYSAGSLRTALTEITDAYTATYGTPVEMVFGASGAALKATSATILKRMLTPSVRVSICNPQYDRGVPMPGRCSSGRTVCSRAARQGEQTQVVEYLC